MKKCLLITVLVLFSIIAFSQSIVSVNPNYVLNGAKAGITVTGIGTHFYGIDIDTFVEIKDGFGGFINIDSVFVISDTSVVLYINVPQKATKGFRDIIFNDNSVSNYQGIYGKHNAIYIDNPSNSESRILNVTPNKADPDQHLDVTVTGANTDFTSFLGDSPTGEIYFTDMNGNSNSIIIDNKDVINKESMTLSLYISAYALKGYYDLVAVDTANTGGNSLNYYGLHSAIFIDAAETPQILSVVPGYAQADDSPDLTITGKNTHFLKFKSDQYASLKFVNQFDNNSSDIVINNITVLNDTVMTVSTYVDYRATIGFRDLEISDSSSYYNNYGIKDALCIGPYLSSITPDNIKVNDTVTITLDCFNTRFQTKSSKNLKVWLNNSYGYYNDILGTDITVINQQQISAKFNIPADVYESYWNVFIADDYDGVFYRNKILKIGNPLFTNVIDNPVKNNMKVYPNPVSDALYLEYKLEHNSPVTMDIYNITSKVYSFNFGTKPVGINNEKIDVQNLDLKAGIYMLRLNTDKHTYYTKIAKF